MRNRAAVATLAAIAIGLVVAALPVGAQAPRPARVGVLTAGVTTAAFRQTAQFAAFRATLAELGYREGHNLVLEARTAERQSDLAAPAQELIQLKVDVIVAGGVAAARAAKSATQSIPIVGVAVGGDPVAQGFAQSIARPGGNFTGFLYGGLDPGKLFQLLKEAFPGITRAGLVWNPDNPIIMALRLLESWDTGARAAGLSLKFVQARSLEELDAGFATLVTEKISTAFVVADALWLTQDKRAAETAVRHRVAVIWGHASIADAGGLMAYAADIVDQWRQSAAYVKRILTGTPAGDLPLQYPSRWMLVVNLKAAKAIGVAVSPTTVARADRVIE